MNYCWKVDLYLSQIKRSLTVAFVGKEWFFKMKTTKTRVRVLPLLCGVLSLSLALPAFGGTHKTSYPNACGEVWGAVKDTLGVPEHYTVEETDDANMRAYYHVKHSVHVTVTGALRQRTNHVSLVTKGTGCEMQVVSSYSGFEHNDGDDFKKRVEESLGKLTAPKPAEAAKDANK